MPWHIHKLLELWPQLTTTSCSRKSCLFYYVCLPWSCNCHSLILIPQSYTSTVLLHLYGLRSGIAPNQKLSTSIDFSPITCHSSSFSSQSSECWIQHDWSRPSTARWGKCTFHNYLLYDHFFHWLIHTDCTTVNISNTILNLKKFYPYFQMGRYWKIEKRRKLPLWSCSEKKITSIFDSYIIMLMPLICFIQFYPVAVITALNTSGIRPNKNYHLQKSHYNCNSKSGWEILATKSSYRYLICIMSKILVLIFTSTCDMAIHSALLIPCQSQNMAKQSSASWEQQEYKAISSGSQRVPLLHIFNIVQNTAHLSSDFYKN